MQVLTEKEIIIIGGGVAGIGTALKLANQGHKVKILERNILMSGSSGRNPGRMGHGFHYFDEHTAIQYLRASLQVQLAYPGFLVGDDLPFEHPIRHGRYYITKTSQHSFEDVLKIYRVIQAEYARLVEQDSKNKVFGEPKDFIKILEPKDYEHLINTEIVAGAVETCEHLFNWPKFSAHIKKILLTHPNISLLEHSEVIGIHSRESLDARFTIDVLQTIPAASEKHAVPQKITFKTDFLINASWENIEYLNATAGIPYQNGARTNRLKCLLIVKLPKELTEPQMNSAFFCMGPFCMFSNMGDGRGMMTLADVTNMKVSSQLKIDKEMEYYLSDKVDEQEKQRIGQEILTGVAKYIPSMARAEILDVKFGIVQTKGALQLEDLKLASSAHHKRNYFAVRAEQQGLISNPAMKLFYFVHNSQLVYQMFKVQLEKESYLPEFYHHLFKDLDNNISLETKKSIMRYVDSALVGEDLNDFYFPFTERLETISRLILQKHKFQSVLAYMIPRLNEDWPHVKKKINLHNKIRIKNGIDAQDILQLRDSYGEYIRYRERAFLKNENFFYRGCQLILEQFNRIDPKLQYELFQYCKEILLQAQDFDDILLKFPQSLYFAEKLFEIKYQLILSHAKTIMEPRSTIFAAAMPIVSHHPLSLEFHEEKSSDYLVQPRTAKVNVLSSSLTTNIFSPISPAAHSGTPPRTIRYAKDDSITGIKASSSSFFKIIRSYSQSTSSHEVSALTSPLQKFKRMSQSQSNLRGNHDEKHEFLEDFDFFRSNTPLPDTADMDSREFCLD